MRSSVWFAFERRNLRVLTCNFRVWLAAPVAVTVGDAEPRPVAADYARLLSLVVNPLIIAVVAQANVWLCRAFGAELRFWQAFNLFALAALWQLLAALLQRLSAELALSTLGNVCGLVTLVVGLSALTQRPVLGSFITLVLSVVSSLCCGLCVISSVLVGGLGIAAGVLSQMDFEGADEWRGWAQEQASNFQWEFDTSEL